jgi:preprotein translocase SecE subunit
VARDRQRAKQRRRRQSQAPGGSGPRRSPAREREEAAREMGLDDAGVDEAGLGEAPPEAEPGSSVFPSLGGPPPGSLEHASGFADEARAAEAGAPLPPEDAEDLEDEVDYEPAPDEVEGDLVPYGRVDPAVAEEAAEHERGAPPPSGRRARFIVFLGHVWDELRRVQWPDRRQVGQATAVVLGFIVVAGGYLGLLDALWKPLIDAIL